MHIVQRFQLKGSNWTEEVIVKMHTFPRKPRVHMDDSTADNFTISKQATRACYCLHFFYHIIMGRI